MKTKNEVVFSAVLLIIAGASQAVVLDQSQEQLGGNWLVICPDWSIAQTFTTGLSGQLDKIDVYLDNTFFSEIDLYPTTFSIVNVDNEVPTDSVLGTVYADNLVSGWNSIDFSSQSILLNDGNQYAIVVYNDDSERYSGDSTQWRASNSDVYDEGSLWIYIDGEWTQVVTPPGGYPDEIFYDKDAAFRTYMVPELATICFLVSGCFILLRSCIYSKHQS